ncbi:DNA-binding response regulator [Sphingomonas sp. ABOLD]|uniref:DNA-binding NarL/FixJ family response regulator n=1 Tax=Sphingomonas trueperi TaxID=53317 RepID=A0A7X6BCK6_9SPHN|nr:MULTISPECIES: response regulator transcription factor [Sphingomonas]NJB98194.1 DNA-binding NarL/FixJ family response regulator [Sphingomonas trueperi]RSV44181.1 DNA-binding response regulator [Sphingomonas sp. ABOLD]
MTSKPIRILVADDHVLLRQGIAGIVAPEPDLEIVGEAANGAEAVAAFERMRPDITLMDLQMPILPGIEAISRIRDLAPNARIIVLTTYPGDVQAVKALKAGAYGYLLKSSLIDELLTAIRTVHGGRRFIPADVAQEIALHSAEEPLSDREVEILTLVSAGKANKLVAHELRVSEQTVKAHLRTIFQKLGVSDRTQAVTTALRRGIINL